MSEEVKLLPCPFCGGDGKVYPTELGFAEYRAFCDSCCFGLDPYDTKDKALEVWNKIAQAELDEIASNEATLVAARLLSK